MFNIKFSERSLGVIALMVLSAAFFVSKGNFINSVASANTPSLQGFVTRSGTEFLLNGEPFRFTGINIYNANTTTSCWYSMNPGFDTALADFDSGTSGKSKVVRAWFFQHLATTGGVRDWTSFDRTLSLAQARGFKVIVTLGNQWYQCDGWPDATSGYKGESWYETGYKTVSASAPGHPQSYRDFVAAVVTRYKDNPTIMMWQLMNEAEAKPVYGGTCSSDRAYALMRAFTDDMGALVKSIDKKHLLSLGTIGSGQCGSSSARYLNLHASPYIDVCEYHDYNYTTVAMPGDQWNGLQVRINQCNELDKPIFNGEVGIRSDDPAVMGNLQTRANYYASKFAAQFAAGVRGQLVWDWRNSANGGSSSTGYEIGPGDPVLSVLATYGFTPTPAPSPTPGDTTPPSAVSFRAPQNGATIGNSTKIRAIATDNIGVTKMELYINGVLETLALKSPLVYLWDSSAFSGAVTLQVRAYDAANNMTSSSISVSK